MPGDIVFRISTEREEIFWASFVFQELTWSRHSGWEGRQPGVIPLVKQNLCYDRIFKGAKLNAQAQLTTVEYYWGCLVLITKKYA